MSILVGKETRVVGQGITGKSGAFHANHNIEYGTNYVAGVTPGKGGSKWEERLPIFNSVAEAVKKEGANTSIIFVPSPFAADAILEAVDAGIETIICITEGIPVTDMVKVKAVIKATKRPIALVGPNCPGVITPGVCNLGIMPPYIAQPGKVGVVSRSGTLTYEVVYQLTQLGEGQSSCVGIGGDPVQGLNFLEVIKLFNEDSQTEAIVLIGEIGGEAEEEATNYIKTSVQKPVVGFIAGQTAPKGRRMGHAGAIVSSSGGSAAEKIRILEAAGVTIAPTPAVIGKTLVKAL